MCDSVLNHARRNRHAIFYLLFPSLVLVLLFIIALAMLLGYSFYEYVRPGVMKPSFTLENYVTFLTSSTYLRVLYRTVKISLIATVLALVMGYPISYRIVRTKSSLIRKLYVLIVLISFLSSILVRLFSWRVILGRTGLINQVLDLLGFSGLHSFLRTETAVTTGLVSFLVPFVVLTLVGVIDKIDPELESAAKSLGANEITTFFKVTLPLSMSGILAASLLCYCLGMSAFIIPLMLGGDVVKLLANVVYDQALLVVNFPIASTAAVILLVVSFVVIASYQKLLQQQL